MAAAPKDDARPEDAAKWARLAHVVKGHPLMAVISVLGTLATFVVGTTRVTGLVFDGGTTPIGETIPQNALLLPPGAGYDYVTITDQTGQISVDAPTAWRNVLGNGWHARRLSPVPEGELIGPGLNAAPSVDAWRSDTDFETPGFFIGASEQILDEYEPQEILQRVAFDGCRTTGSGPYTNDDFTGATVTWSCPKGAQWRVLAATPTESREYLVYLQVKLVSPADVEAYNRVLTTFEVDFDA